MKLNKWQREILKLEQISDKDMNRKLFNAYNDALKDVRKRLKAYMDEYEDLPYYKQQQAGKLSALEKEIVDMLNGAYPTAKFEVTDFKRNEMMDGYYSSMYQIEAETGARLDFLGLDTEFVRQSVTKPIAGKTLSNRLYKSRVKLANRATSEIRTGMMQGKTYAEIAGAITRHTEANYQQAVRIARTEGGRLRSLAKQEALNEAKELGIDLQKRWYSSLDNRTRSSHRLLDGQTVEIDEDFVSPESGAKGPMPRMLGRASEDIGCRCTTVNIVDGIAPESRYAKNDDGHGYEKVEYKSYGEWQKSRIGDDGASVPVWKTASQVISSDVVLINNAKRFSDVQIELRKAAEESSAAYKNIDSIDPITEKEAYLKAVERNNEAVDRYRKLQNELREIELGYVENNANRVKELLSEYRPMGTDGINLKGHITNARAEVSKLLTRVYEYIPTEWIERSVNYGTITTKKVSRGYYIHGKKAELAVSGQVGVRNSFRTALHEMMHRQEGISDAIIKAEKEFYEHRTKGEALLKLKDVTGNSGYRDSETTKVDNFLDPYMGKDYGGGNYELLSMGADTLYADPIKLAEDQEMFDWVVEMLLTK